MSHTAHVTLQHCRDNCPGFITKDKKAPPPPHHQISMLLTIVCGQFLRVRPAPQYWCFEESMGQTVHAAINDFLERLWCVEKAIGNYIEWDFLVWFIRLWLTLCFLFLYISCFILSVAFCLDIWIWCFFFLCVCVCVYIFFLSISIYFIVFFICVVHCRIFVFLFYPSWILSIEPSFYLYIFAHVNYILIVCLNSFTNTFKLEYLYVYICVCLY